MTPRQKAIQAFERLNGQSVLPLMTQTFKHQNGAECILIMDGENSSWAIYNIDKSHKRIARITFWLEVSGKPYIPPSQIIKAMQGKEAS